MESASGASARVSSEAKVGHICWSLKPARISGHVLMITLINWQCFLQVYSLFLGLSVNQMQEVAEKIRYYMECEPPNSAMRNVLQGSL